MVESFALDTPLQFVRQIASWADCDALAIILQMVLQFFSLKVRTSKVILPTLGAVDVSFGAHSVDVLLEFLMTHFGTATFRTVE